METLKELIKNSKHIVFFGGAGVSTESGLKDFRSKDGLYHMKYKYNPEEILSHTFFLNNPEEFYIFYKDKLNSLHIKPNITHYYLANLEKKGKLKAIITQNIDGLHQKAGSKNVIELHGSIYNNYCMKCGKYVKAEEVFQSKGIPKCSCGGIIKPDVVLYEEELKDENVKNAKNALEQADLLIVAGTSLTVYPASLFIRFFHGTNLIIINQEKTNYDKIAKIVIHEKLGTVIKQLKEK